MNGRRDLCVLAFVLHWSVAVADDRNDHSSRQLGSDNPRCKRPKELKVRQLDPRMHFSVNWKDKLKRKLEKLPGKDYVDSLLSGGYSEFFEDTLGSWSNFLHDLQDESEGFASIDSIWRTRLEELSSIAKVAVEDNNFMNIFGSDLLRPAVIATHWLGKFDAELLQLSDSDVKLAMWLRNAAGPDRLWPHLGPCPGNTMCSCMMVSCQPSDGGFQKGSILAFDIRTTEFIWPANLAELGSDAGWPVAPSVRGLFLEGHGTLSRPSWWHTIFPYMEILGLTIEGKDAETSDWAFLLNGWADTLLGLKMTVHRRVGADGLKPICHLRKLRRLKLDGPIRGLPGCLGELPLIDLSISGMELHGQEALPQALVGLNKSLTNFVAFSQGRDHMCPMNPPQDWGPVGIPHHLQKCRVRPSWDPGDYDTSWQCPWEGWMVRLDDPDAPWWAWERLERLWIDANFIHGQFPENLAQSWPAMRSLDLQLNEIEGPVPASLGYMKNLSQLRLHRNRFEGEVPAEIFKLHALERLVLEGNSNLRGCLHTQPHGNGHIDVEVQGTRIKGLCGAVKPSTASGEL